MPLLLTSPLPKGEILLNNNFTKFRGLTAQYEKDNQQ